MVWNLVRLGIKGGLKAGHAIREKALKNELVEADSRARREYGLFIECIKRGDQKSRAEAGEHFAAFVAALDELVDLIEKINVPSTKAKIVEIVKPLFDERDRIVGILKEMGSKGGGGGGTGAAKQADLERQERERRERERQERERQERERQERERQERERQERERQERERRERERQERERRERERRERERQEWERSVAEATTTPEARVWDADKALTGALKAVAEQLDWDFIFDREAALTDHLEKLLEWTADVLEKVSKANEREVIENCEGVVRQLAELYGVHVQAVDLSDPVRALVTLKAALLQTRARVEGQAWFCPACTVALTYVVRTDETPTCPACGGPVQRLPTPSG